MRKKALQTNLNLLSLAKGLQGGINDPTLFPRWLDDNLYEGATFKTLLYQRRPYIWINASDIYDRTPFVFGPVLFGALCSDLANYPVSIAVAASAAVPVVFAPVVIERYPGGCPVPLPHWVHRVRSNPNAPPLLRNFANAMYRYHSGEVRYVKLLDGGIVDNYGLAGFTIARLASDTPYGPLQPEEGVKLRRMLFLVVDAGRAPSGAWSQTVEGPSGANLITAASDTATESGAVGSYSSFQDTMNNWQAALIDWRCRLSAAERHRYGAPPGWNCRDVKISVGRIAFDQLDPQRAALNAVETSFKLPPDQVDMVIAAGHDALKSNSVFRSFVASLGGAPRPPSVPCRHPARLRELQVRQEPLRPPRRNSAAATTSNRYPSRCVSISETGWLVRSLPTSATIRFFTSAWKARRKSASVRGGAAMTRAGTARLRTTLSSAAATRSTKRCSSR